MLVYESVQGLTPLNVYPHYEIKKIYINGAFSMNVARKHVKQSLKI